LAVGVVQIAEVHRAARATLDARRDIIALAQLPALDSRLLLGLLKPLNAERTLLDYALGAHGHVGIQVVLHILRPFRQVPVEVLYRVGAGVGAVATSDASRINLRDQPFGILVRSG